MNMLQGTVQGGDGDARVAFADGVALPLPRGFRADEGQSVVYGIRPEHCGVGANGGLPADVVVVEPTGADTQLYCRVHGRDVTATIRDRTDCRAGDRIVLVPDASRAHLFDATSGRRLAA